MLDTLLQVIEVVPDCNASVCDVDCVGETDQGGPETPVNLYRTEPELPYLIKRKVQIILPTRNRKGDTDRAAGILSVAGIKLAAPEPAQQTLDLVERLHCRGWIVDRW